MKIKLKPLDTLLAERTYREVGELLGLTPQNLTGRLNSKKPQYVDEQNRIWILSHETPAQEVQEPPTKIHT